MAVPPSRERALAELLNLSFVVTLNRCSARSQQCSRWSNYAVGAYHRSIRSQHASFHPNWSSCCGFAPRVPGATNIHWRNDDVTEEHLRSCIVYTRPDTGKQVQRQSTFISRVFASHPLFSVQEPQYQLTDLRPSLSLMAPTFILDRDTLLSGLKWS